MSLANGAAPHPTDITLRKSYLATSGLLAMKIANGGTIDNRFICQYKLYTNSNKIEVYEESVLRTRISYYAVNSLPVWKIELIVHESLY